MPSNEADLLLALEALMRGQFRSVREAASVYNVPASTLRSRIAGTRARPDCQPNLKKLTEIEEEVIVGFVLELDSRGFPPSLNIIREMGNKLLAARGAGKVGKLWPHNFVKRTESLTTRFNQPYDY